MTGQSNNRRRQGTMAALALLAGGVLVCAPRFAAAAPPQVSPPAFVQSVVSSGPLTLTATMDSRVSEGQPADLMLTVRNNGPKTLIVGGSAFERSAFHFAVIDEKGHEAAPTNEGHFVLTPPTAVTANSTVEIGSGQTLQYRVNLARLFDLSRPGVYTISAGRIFGPWAFKFSVPKPGMQLSSDFVSLTAGPLKFQMVEEPSGFSGPVAYAPPPDHQTFLYMASTSNTGIVRYRVGADGGVSYAYQLPETSTAPPAPPSILGIGPDFLVVTPDYRFLYAETRSANIISQYKIGDDGVLSPLSPPTVPLPVENDMTPRPLVIASDGRFLYSETGAFYAIDAHGGLTLRGRVFRGDLPPDQPLSVLRHASGIDSSVTFIEGGYKYHIDFNGASLPAEKPKYGPPIVTPTEPVLRWGASGLVYAKNYSSFKLKPWAVDPSGHFLVVLRQNALECYRIGGRKLTLLNKTKINGYQDSAFFVPGSPLVYVSQPPDLLVFGLDNKQGLVPTAVPAELIPFDAIIISASAPTPLVWGKAVEGLAISVHLPANTLLTTQPVVLTVTLKNTTSRPLRLGTLGTDMTAFRLSIQGSLLAAGRDLLNTSRRDNTPLILPPGEKRQYRFVLSRLTDLTANGDYTVQVTRTLPDGKAAVSPVLPLTLNDPPQSVRYGGKNWVLNIP